MAICSPGIVSNHCRSLPCVTTAFVLLMDDDFGFRLDGPDCPECLACFILATSIQLGDSNYNSLQSKERELSGRPLSRRCGDRTTILLAGMVNIVHVPVSGLEYCSVRSCAQPVSGLESCTLQHKLTANNLPCKIQDLTLQYSRPDTEGTEGGGVRPAPGTRRHGR